MKKIITHKITQSLSLIFLGFIISIPILTFFNTTVNTKDIEDNSTITTENTRLITENSYDIKNLEKKTTQPSTNKE